jgi:hypothetical protein
MSEERSLPMRYLAAILAAVLSGTLAVVVHYESVELPTTDGMMIATPPPPAATFPEAFLVIPGVLAGLPLVLTGAILELEWVTQIGLILGAIFFWYCIGWQVDCVGGSLKPKPPRIVRWYLSALVLLSIVSLPFGVLAGVNLGVHSCASGVPPYWVELVSYGILMFWITIGVYFGWMRFQARKAEKHPSAIFRF